KFAACSAPRSRCSASPPTWSRCRNFCGRCTPMANRVLYDQTRVHAIFAKMRDELAELRARNLPQSAALRRPVEALRVELDQIRALYAELRAISTARQAAEKEVAEMKARREALLRAFGAERDPTQPLQ